MQKLRLIIKLIAALTFLLKEIRLIVPIIKQTKINKAVVLKIIIAALIFLVSSCVSQSVQKLSPMVYYKNDLVFEYKSDNKNIKEFSKRFGRVKYRNRLIKKDTVEFYGVGVLPEQETYYLKVKAHGKLDFFNMWSCHEDYVSNDRDDGIFKKNGVTDIEYTPTIEKGMACPVFIATYNKTQKHGFGLLAFENERFKLKATLHCNGFVQEANGVSICQTKFGLYQEIIFDEEVKALKPVNGPADRKVDCPALDSQDMKSFKFLMPPRECVYGFIGKKSKHVHKFYTIGYESIIVR